MDSFKLAVKYFLTAGSRFDQSSVVPVFHNWIQNHSVDEHLLIDVADYHHVQNGPGTVLVAHEGNYSTDLAIGGGPGLLYTRKQPIAGDFASRLRATFKYTLSAMVKLQSALGGATTFRTDNPVFRIYDRLLTPSTQSTFDAVRPDLQAFLDGLYAALVRLDYSADAENVFEVKITAAPAEASMLLSRL